MGTRKKRKKGSLEETLSFATFADNPDTFSVTYRDMDALKEATLKDFMNREDLSEIPITRIVSVARKGKIVWTKGQKEVYVKKYGRQ